MSFKVLHLIRQCSKIQIHLSNSLLLTALQIKRVCGNIEYRAVIKLLHLKGLKRAGIFEKMQLSIVLCHDQNKHVYSALKCHCCAVFKNCMLSIS
jgi:hypothetical protein